MLIKLNVRGKWHLTNSDHTQFTAVTYCGRQEVWEKIFRVAHYRNLPKENLLCKSCQRQIQNESFSKTP